MSSHIDFFHKLKFLRNRNETRGCRNGNGKTSRARRQESCRPSTSPIPESCSEECSQIAAEFRMLNNLQGNQNQQPNLNNHPTSPALQNGWLEQWLDQISPPPLASPAAFSKSGSAGAGTVTERLAKLRAATLQDRQESQQAESEDCFLYIEHEYFVYSGGPDWIPCDASELSGKLPALPPPRTPGPPGCNGADSFGRPGPCHCSLTPPPAPPAPAPLASRRRSV